MFIIFGWGKRTVTEYGPIMPMTCSNCNNEVYWHLTRIKEWFTLFFIPVIPYDSQHLLMCPICSYGVQLHGSQIDKAKELTVPTQQYLGERITDTAYMEALSRTRVFE